MLKDVSFQFLHGCNALGIVAASFLGSTEILYFAICWIIVFEAIRSRNKFGTASQKDIAESPTEAILQGFGNLVGMSAGNAQKNIKL